LEKTGEIIFSSSHYGTELLINGIDEQEIELLRTFATEDAKSSVWDTLNQV